MSSGWSIEDAIEHGIVDRQRVDAARQTLDELAQWMSGDAVATRGAPSVRGNVHDLPDDEAMRLQSALLGLNRPENPVWGRFVFVHAAVTPLIHGHPELRYLPWHRVFLSTFERALGTQALGAGLHLPYWTWWHAHMPARAELPQIWRDFAPAIVMPDVRRDAGLAELCTALAGPEVVDAVAVADVSMTVTQWRAHLAALARGGQLVVERGVATTRSGFDADAVRMALAQPVAGDFGAAMEALGDAVATAHGGAMAEPRSRMADVTALFAHVEIDRLWASWQRDHVERLPTPMGVALPPWSVGFDDAHDLEALHVAHADQPIDDPRVAVGSRGEAVIDAPWSPERVLGESELAEGTEAVTLVYKIHPGIGIARVGDSPDEWFVGPETPGRHVRPVAGQFRDRNHKIKRQAARFRIWEYEQSSTGKLTPKREITSTAAKIKWTVNIANKKAAFFEFQYTTGQRTASGPPLSGFGSSHALRNPSVGPSAGPWDHPDRRAKLWIAPGPVTLAAAEGAHTIIESTSTEVPIRRLGVLRTDRLGRLYVYGGHGRAKPKISGTPLTGTFNNAGWFDDVSDGPVSAQLVFPDGRTVTLGGWTGSVREGDTPGTDGGGAWVIVGPPDYAPQIANMMTLYDVLLDVARVNLPVPNNALYDVPTSGTGSPGQLWRLTRLKAGLGTYVPSFTHEVFPILVRVLDQRWVDSVLQGMMGTGGFHGPTDPNALWNDLSTKASTRRGGVFARIRPWSGAPTGAQTMPKLWGDDYTSGPGLRLTETQYRILERWKDGHFVEDWPGAPPPEPAESITPDGLDRAGLESTVGGALAVGIEASWLIRDPQNFAEPFRIKHHADLPPGHFSAQMALPWHTDFHACARTRDLGWWPAIRPDEVFVKGSTAMQPWARDDAGSGITREAFATGAWAKLGFVLDINGDRSKFEERERG